MAMKIKMKNILGALGALALVLGAGPAPAAEAFKAGLVEVFAQREGPWQRGFLNLAGYDGGGANGMKMDRQGCSFIAHRTKGIVALDPKTKQMEVLVDNYKDSKLHGPNDLFFDSKGNCGSPTPAPPGCIARPGRSTGSLSVAGCSRCSTISPIPMGSRSRRMSKICMSQSWATIG